MASVSDLRIKSRNHKIRGQNENDARQSLLEERGGGGKGRKEREEEAEILKVKILS